MKVLEAVRRPSPMSLQPSRPRRKPESPGAVGDRVGDVFGMGELLRRATKMRLETGDDYLVRAERILMLVMTEAQFSFRQETLGNLSGFMLTEDDDSRVIVADSELDRPNRICLYLRCLGHVALGHELPRFPSVTCAPKRPYRLPSALQLEGYEADKWVVWWIEKELASHRCAASSEFLVGARQALEIRRRQRGGIRWLLERTSNHIFLRYPVAHQTIRRNLRVQAMLSTAYWGFGWLADRFRLAPVTGSKRGPLLA